MFVNDPKKLILILPVWGKKYIETFERVLIRSLLQKENLKELQSIGNSELRIVTNSESKKYLEELDGINQLRTSIKVHFIVVENKFQDKYLNMTDKYIIGIKYDLDKISDHDFYLFLVPDLYLLDGTLSQVTRKLKIKPVIQVMGFRMNRENFLINLDIIVNHDKEGVIDYIKENLHSVCLSSVFNNNFDTLHPSHLYWLSRDKFVGRGFHLHPLAIQASPIAKNIEKFDELYTIDDWRFLSKSGLTKRDCMVIQDDSILLLELTSQDFESSRDRSKYSNKILYKYIKVILWASIAGNTNKLQRSFFGKKIVIQRKNSRKGFNFREGYLLSKLVYIFAPLLRPFTKHIRRLVSFSKISSNIDYRKLIFRVFILPVYFLAELKLFIDYNRLNKSLNWKKFYILSGNSVYIFRFFRRIIEKLIKDCKKNVIKESNSQ